MKKTRLAERRRAQRIMFAYRSGLTDPEEISARVGLGPELVKKVLRKAGVPLGVEAVEAPKPTTSETVPPHHPQRGRERLGETTHKTPKGVSQ